MKIKVRYRIAISLSVFLFLFGCVAVYLAWPTSVYTRQEFLNLTPQTTALSKTVTNTNSVTNTNLEKDFIPASPASSVEVAVNGWKTITFDNNASYEEKKQEMERQYIFYKNDMYADEIAILLFYFKPLIFLSVVIFIISFFIGWIFDGFKKIKP